jgi:hypothetical protein
VSERDDDPDPDDVFAEPDQVADVSTASGSANRSGTRRALREAQDRGPFGRPRGSFDFRDAGESLLGSFLFGIPTIVGDGTLAAGEYVARSPPAFAATLALGLGLVYGIFRAVQFERIEGDLILGVVPLRLLGVLGIVTALAVVPLTMWAACGGTRPSPPDRRP